MFSNFMLYSSYKFQWKNMTLNILHLFYSPSHKNTLKISLFKGILHATHFPCNFNSISTCFSYVAACIFSISSTSFIYIQIIYLGMLDENNSEITSLLNYISIKQYYRKTHYNNFNYNSLTRSK